MKGIIAVSLYPSQSSLLQIKHQKNMERQEQTCQG